MSGALIELEVEVDAAPAVARLREKCRLSIAPNGSQASIDLTLPLNERYESEAEAIRLFSPDEKRLFLKYRVDIDLETHRQHMLKLVEQLYYLEGAESKREFALAMRRDFLAQLHDEDVRAAFMPIATHGRNVFRRLFQDVEIFEGYSQSDKPLLLDVLRSAFGRENAIVVRTPMSLFPWAFLYDDGRLTFEDATTLELGRFWGFRHQIQEEVEGVAPRVSMTHSPRVVAAVCPQVDPQRVHNDEAFGSRDSLVIEVRTVGDKQDLLSILASPFEHDCFYFCGHSFQDSPPVQATSAILFDGIKLTVDEIDGKGGPQFLRNPVLAFFNGCETSPVGSWSKETLAGFLCHKGDSRVCAVTTTGKVPAALARALGVQFWRRFLNKSASVGEALQGARLTLLAKYGNPLGLLYTVLGRGDIRLER